MKYIFEEIAINSVEKRKPTKEDQALYIGLEHLESGSFDVISWGSKAPLTGEKLVMKKGDVLFGKRNTYLKRVAIAPFDGIFSAHGMILRPNRKVVHERLFPFFLASDYFMREAIRISVGSLSPTINWKDLKELEFNLPPFEEQARIADLLWALNDVKKAHKNLLAATDDLIKARFVELFGDFDQNPKGWKKGKLQDHADVIVGYPFPSEGYTSEGIDIVGGYNLMQGYIRWEDSKYWPDKNGYEKYLLQANDIVMAMDRPWVNGGFKIAQIDALHLPALLIQRTACIRGKDLGQEMLRYQLDSQRFAEHCNVTGSLVPHISNKDINSFQVILPPEDIQKRFSTFVTQVDKSKVAVQKALEQDQALLNSLLRQYFG